MDGLRGPFSRRFTDGWLCLPLSRFCSTASLWSKFKGTVCAVCGVCEVGKHGSGLKLFA
ncbi:hypothetical protein B0T26DRAFT_262548 [Lasiosphaeria miniovina]|uniref:Uncharacterized protein n=1 Tax=Lasiosphaeria miniovina TaxID=1954250 RepID=A0AA40AX25_9PEZI|nr:uncharacterized protein B0T26DRAFT_262548 [Lasiosphaeria miniovina]KAK0723526.1 hypothetical protein B0T26DRAFT_262548 [Lasiosphaeria miniovina]